MKFHTRIYFKESGIDPHGFVECEICYGKAVDIHHIDARGMGGDPQGKRDVFENLMATCRKHHDEYGDKVEFKPMLKRIHAEKFPDKLVYCEETETIKRL